MLAQSSLQLGCRVARSAIVWSQHRLTRSSRQQQQAAAASSSVQRLAQVSTSRHQRPAAAASTSMPSDPDGFDPVADTVGAGIYSGRVKRDAHGGVVIGSQYANHNPVPGPVYSGDGYTEMTQAIHKGAEAVRQLLDAGADANEIMTGGARPLHTCGMSRRGQLSTQLLIDAGADIHALDTYGYTPLHRMASNNLAVGAEALLKAGADVNMRTQAPYAGDTPLRIALQSGASEVAAVLRRYGAQK